jgi:hypothetical protein
MAGSARSRTLDIPPAVEIVPIHTSPKRKRGNKLRPSLARRASVGLNHGRYNVPYYSGSVRATHPRARTSVLHPPYGLRLDPEESLSSVHPAETTRSCPRRPFSHSLKSSRQATRPEKYSTIPTNPWCACRGRSGTCARAGSVVARLGERRLAVTTKGDERKPPYPGANWVRQAGL